jgi:hypothetical protein
MKFLLVPILMLLVLTQSFSKWFIVAGFQANRSYIAANLCENRARPKLKCGGRCQLMKKIAEEEKAASNAGSKAKFEELAWPQERFSMPTNTPAEIMPPMNGIYSKTCPDALVAAPFRPPGC